MFPIYSTLIILLSCVQCGGGDGSDFFSFDPSQEDVDSRSKDIRSDDVFVTVDMKSALKEMKTLCGEGLTGKERRKYEEQRAKELGGKVYVGVIEV